MKLSLYLRVILWWSWYVEHSSNPIIRKFGRATYVLRRYIQGARKITVARPSKSGEVWDLGTGGQYIAEGVDIVFGGACPVQGEGTVDGNECYYRSRGEGWQFHVACDGGDVFDGFEYSERPYIWPEGGWVPTERSMKCIAKGIEKYRAQNGD